VVLVGQPSPDGQTSRLLSLACALSRSGLYAVHYLSYAGSSYSSLLPGLPGELAECGASFTAAEVFAPSQEEVDASGYDAEADPPCPPGELAAQCYRDGALRYLLAHPPPASPPGEGGPSPGEGGGEGGPSPGVTPVWPACSWCASVWSSLLSPLLPLAPSLLLLSATGLPADALPLLAARLLPEPPVAVLDLANLRPPLGLAADVLLSPSLSAASSPGLSAAAASADPLPADILVLPPAVAPPFLSPPAGDAAACPAAETPAALAALPCGPLHPNSGCALFLSLGRLAPEKSLGVALQAFHQAQARMPAGRAIHLAVVGGGRQLASLQRLSAHHAALLGVPDAVSFLGAVPHGAAPAYLAAADAFLNPNANPDETFCLANAEAMAMGVPVVSFGLGGPSDYLSGGETGSVGRTGFVAAEVSAAGLADAILEAAGDERERRRIGEAGRALVAEAYAEENVLADFHALFEAYKGHPERRAAAAKPSKPAVSFPSRDEMRVALDCEPGFRQAEALTVTVCGREDGACQGAALDKLEGACAGRGHGGRVEVAFDVRGDRAELELHLRELGRSEVVAAYPRRSDGAVGRFCEEYEVAEETCGSVRRMLEEQFSATARHRGRLYDAAEGVGSIDAW
jgi:glycosyltransferase involved in cell wall biosynthesis